ncbi:MAG: peptidylprolyl isomerase [Ramlibacter sp.]
MNAAGGCGSGTCGCGGGVTSKAAAAPPVAVATINGIALHDATNRPDEAALRERAWGELLRQEAVRQGLLPRHPDLDAPELSPGDQQVIAAMLERAVPVAHPTEEECLRYYEARKSHYVQGRQVRARHILFAVTTGIDVHKLAVRAEQALLELTRQGCPPGRFAELARELSNCPSGAEGGDLDWLAPDDCADELANEFFHQKEPLHGIGLRPRLVHSRYGFHIVEVVGRKQGRQLPFEEAGERIAVQLAQQSRAKALHQYMQLLAGQALVEGVALEGADSPLVQ